MVGQNKKKLMMHDGGERCSFSVELLVWQQQVKRKEACVENGPKL